MHGTKCDKLSVATLQMQMLPGAFRQPACRQARHFAHTPLHVCHANQRSNNKIISENQSPAAAVNTLALLELLLTQPKVDTETASETSLPVEDISAMPAMPTDAHLTAPGISHQVPTPSDIWTHTWQPLERSQPVQAKQAQAAAASQLQMPVALPSLRFWRQQQQQQQKQQQQQHAQHQQQLSGQSSQKTTDGSVRQPIGLAATAMMRNAQMQLQGIEPAARLQLMALCMASLENLTESLKGVSIRLTNQEWTQICPAVLAVCSVQAGASWLGYCPDELLHQARQVISHLSRVNYSSTSYNVAHSHLSLALQSAAATSPMLAADMPAEMQSEMPSEASQATADAASNSQQDSASNDMTGASSSSISAWQSAEDNLALHAIVLRHMCQHSSGEPPQSQQGADTNMPSPSTDYAQSQLAHPGSGPWSAAQSLRRAAHQIIAGKSKPVNSWPSQGSAKRQRELAALQLTLQSAPAVLQDMASHAAEAVAVCYLAEARSGLSEGGSEGEDWWPLHLHPQLKSTRGLERFRNQVIFHSCLCHHWLFPLQGNCGHAVLTILCGSL
ncbi:TPA: hypothetical protein ACH3X2_012295 [Trebouxia sp. C0005]